MAKRFLSDIDDVRDLLRRRFQGNRAAWLTGDGTWPLVLTLGLPTEAQAAAHLGRLDAWCRQWSAYRGPGQVRWTQRYWPGLGRQRLPEAVVFSDPAQVAELLGAGRQWRQAVARLAAIGHRWPVLTTTAARAWEVLGQWPDEDFDRLTTLLHWLHRHPDSGLLPRQLPVPGVDGKWLEGHGRILAAWLGRLLAREGADLSAVAGLRRPSGRLRLRLLDPALRSCCGGLADIEAPIADIAQLALPVARVFIVENLQTGLAFTDLPGSLVFMGQGYAVDPFGEIPWLLRQPVYYWGDIDTHGLAILHRLRSHLPHARSLLMDQATLLDHRTLWSHEARPAPAAELQRLTGAEAALYQDLRNGRWGSGVRLEQERIAWPYAWQRILDLADHGGP